MAQEIQAIGDRELWVVSGAAALGAKWSLPIFVDFFEANITPQIKRTFARVNPAMTMTPEQESVLESRISAYVYPSEAGHKLIAKSSLNEIAIKAQGITPAFYVQWPDQPNEVASKVEQDSLDPEYLDPSRATEAFLQYVSVQTNVLPLPTLKLAWRALVQCSMTWLAEKKRPIDFGFVELMPVPYRVNWQQVLKAMHPKSPWVITHSKKQDVSRDAMLLEMGLMQNLSNCVLLAVNPNTNCMWWRIEAVHKSEWWKGVEQIEEAHKNKQGPGRYAKHVSAEINRRRSRLVDIYCKWTKEAARPSGNLDQGKLHGSQVIIPWMARGKVNVWNPPCGPVEVCVFGEGSKKDLPKSEKTVALEAVQRLL